MEKLLDKYTYRIEWSEEDEAHVARCLEFPFLSAFGKTIEAALKEIRFVVKEVLIWREENKEPIPEPLGLRKYKGHLTLRVPPEVHRSLVVRSAEARVSINQYILSKISV